MYFRYLNVVMMMAVLLSVASSYAGEAKPISASNLNIKVTDKSKKTKTGPNHRGTFGNMEENVELKITVKNTTGVDISDYKIRLHIIGKSFVNTRVLTLLKIIDIDLNVKDTQSVEISESFKTSYNKRAKTRDMAGEEYYGFFLSVYPPDKLGFEGQELKVLARPGTLEKYFKKLKDYRRGHIFDRKLDRIGTKR